MAPAATARDQARNAARIPAEQASLDKFIAVDVANNGLASTALTFDATTADVAAVEALLTTSPEDQAKVDAAIAASGGN